MAGDQQPRRTVHTGRSPAHRAAAGSPPIGVRCEEHVVQATWGIYQRIVAACREPDQTTRGKQMMRRVIASVAGGVSAALIQIRRLGRMLKQRSVDVLASFDRHGTSYGPTEVLHAMG